MAILTETQRDLINCLKHHQIDKETATIILLLLRETKRGQIMLMDYLLNTEALTEKQIMKKTMELKEMKD